MQIEQNAAGGVLTVSLEGRLDTITAPELERELKRSVTGAIEQLVFDFKGLEYMSSAGIRVIMAAEKALHRKGGIKLINVNDEILEIFEITGLADFLNIE